MKFYQSRVEQLAKHLRESIGRGEYFSPLPSVRDWGAKLGAAHSTLVSAIKILKRDGLVRTQPRQGIYLVRRTNIRKSFQQPPLIRWLVYGRKYQESVAYAEILTALGQRLAPHGIRLDLEICSATRLKAIQREGPRNDQMLVLPSFPQELQDLFAGFEKSALVIGHPFPGIRLPYITVDVFGALPHAVWLLVRRGFSRISLVISRLTRQPIEERFRRACMEPSPPIHGNVVRVPEELLEQNSALRYLARRVSGRHAFIVISPIPVGPLMMALMQRRMNFPHQVDAVGMNTASSDLRTVPLVPYYPYPIERFSKAVCKAAVQYFEQGALPPLKTVIPLRVVLAPR